jgi:hypothetical protein
MYTESPPLVGIAASKRPFRPRPRIAYRSSVKKVQFAGNSRWNIGQIPRFARISILLLSGVAGTLVCQSYGAEIVRAWIPSLGWLLPAPAPGPAVTSPELQAQLKPVAIDLAIMRRSIEQLAVNQDQFARKQEQMAQAIMALQAAERDINQNILALAPLAPKAGHVSSKPAQLPAQ